MITRSRARAERECTPTSIEHNRILRKPKVPLREPIATLSFQSEDMGRRGGNSHRGTSNRSKPVHTPDVAPIRLFSMAEEEDISFHRGNPRGAIVGSLSSSAEKSGGELGSGEPVVEVEGIDPESRTSESEEGGDDIEEAEQVRSSTQIFSGTAGDVRESYCLRIKFRVSTVADRLRWPDLPWSRSSVPESIVLKSRTLT